MLCLKFNFNTILLYIFLGVSLLIWIYFVKSYIKHYKQSNINTLFIKLSYIIACLLYLTTIIGWIFVIILSQLNNYCNNINPLVTTIFTATYYLGCVHVYLLYFFRLVYTFEHTNEATTKVLKIVFILCYIILLIIGIGSIFIVAYSNNIHFKMSFFYIFIALYQASFIGLVRLFFKKSIKFIKNNNNNNIGYQFISLISQYLNCILITFITSFIVLIIIGITVYLSHAGIVSHETFTIIFVISVILDININIIFLHLQFKYNIKKYQYCCKNNQFITTAINTISNVKILHQQT